MAEAAAKLCSNPGCDQPGTNHCSACKTTVYCCVICQTTDWPRHKEECSGHLHKTGMANIAKAAQFQRERNWAQTLRYAELAATKLKKLKDRSLGAVKVISDALSCQFNALASLDRQREALACAEECYTLWAMNHLRHSGSIRAALTLIESCIHNREYEDAERYARHAYFMIAEMTDNFIPVDEQPWFLAEVSYYLALSILRSTEAGGIPPEEKQKVGEEAITVARKALEMRTRLHGIESGKVAGAMSALADVLDYFNDVDDDEALRLLEQAIATYRRVEGNSTMNVATGEFKLANAYNHRAKKAVRSNDLDRCVAILELELSHRREAARIYKAINQMDKANQSLHKVGLAEKQLRLIEIARAEGAIAAIAAVAAEV